MLLSSILLPQYKASAYKSFFTQSVLNPKTEDASYEIVLDRRQKLHTPCASHNMTMWNTKEPPKGGVQSVSCGPSKKYCSVQLHKAVPCVLVC